jgi:hypothetical protein
VADEREEKPEGETPAEDTTASEPARETAVGHQVVEAEQPQPAAAPPPDTGGTSPAAADRQAAESHDPFTEKPELFIGGAFVGAFVFAKLLKKLTGGGD